jgi:hypothetical protein
MTWPDLHVVLALLLALTPAAIIGWAIGAALDRNLHRPARQFPGPRAAINRPSTRVGR